MLFHNLSIKIFSLVLAVLFWIFVVSLENSFYQFPQKIPVQAFNLASNLALTGELPGVQLTLRAQDEGMFKRLTASDFEAYVDLGRVGVGETAVPVSVTVKNPLVSVVRFTPESVVVEVENVREKRVNLVSQVTGQPGDGVRIERVELTQNTVTIKGAEKVLENIASAKAEIVLSGKEQEDVLLKATVHVFDRSGVEISGLEISEEITATVYFSEVELAKSVGVRAKITGSLENGTVKKIQVNPAVVVIVGSKKVIEKIEILETEPIDISAAPESFEKKVLLQLPERVDLAKGQAKDVSVQVEIERAGP